MKRLILAAVLLASSIGCAALRPVLAENDDLGDYTAFRVAAHRGTRLARAQRYLEAHPRGLWAADVARIFEEEEPAYFEEATASRELTREYLTDLPRGPHADAAVALLTAFDRRVEDEATARMLREARRTEAMLDRADAQRRATGETILAWLAALLDEGTYDRRLDDAAPALRRALTGSARPTWGTLRGDRETDLFFSLPTHLERESRVLTLAIKLTVRDGYVVAGTIEGVDLFVRWDEADEMHPLDPTDQDDRAKAARHAKDLLAGALEARFPARRCDATDPRDPALVARACDDWVATVRMADGAGAPDSIAIRGPRRVPALTPRETGRRTGK